jgi:phospholipid transport system substrate-binding protein
MAARKWLYAHLILFVLVLVPVSVARADSGPMAQLQVTVDEVLDVLRDKGLPLADKRRQVTALVSDRFNFEAMSQGVLGINWRRATPEQRQRFTDFFTKLLDQTYRSRIEAYSGEKVKYVEQRVQDGRAEVDTLIVTDQNKEIPISYRLLDQGDKWLVYDVKIEGVSLVLNYRASYANIIQKDGLDGLLKQMAEKVEELKHSDGTQPDA